MLNIPETIIIHNQENLNLGSSGAKTNSPSHGVRLKNIDEEESDIHSHFIYLRNP